MVWTESPLVWDVRRSPDRAHVAGGRSLQARKQVASSVGGHGGEAAQFGARPGNGRQPGGAAKTCTVSDGRRVLRCHLPRPTCLDCSHLVGLRLSPPLPSFRAGTAESILQPCSSTLGHITTHSFRVVPTLHVRGGAASALTLCFDDSVCLQVCRCEHKAGTWLQTFSQRPWGLFHFCGRYCEGSSAPWC